MTKELVQTRVPDSLKERIENYQESNEHLNQSESIRHLLRAGLDAETDADHEADADQESDAEPELGKAGSVMNFDPTARRFGGTAVLFLVVLLAVNLLHPASTVTTAMSLFGAFLGGSAGVHLSMTHD